MDPPAFLTTERARVEEALAEISRDALADAEGPLHEPIRYALATSGKRLRPVLCVAAYAAATGGARVPEAVYRLACALEVVHTYSLIHDDLPCMDDDDLRRGRPTLHRVYGTGLAMLAGAALLPLAVEVLARNGLTLGLDPAEVGTLVRELAEAAGACGMVGGQLLDLQAESRTVRSDELEAIHRRKTGALLTASLRLGAMAGRGGPDLLDALTRYGNALGLAFQITDDLLDVEGTSADLGKTAGRDIALQKASYPALHGIEGARKLARMRIEEARAAIAPYRLENLETLADYVLERRN